MALLLGAKFLNQSVLSNEPHVFGFNTPRSAANDTLVEVWNAATNAGIKAAIDKDGKFYSAALTAGDLLYGVAGGVSGVKRLDSLAIGAANTVLSSSGTAPQWSTSLTLAGTLGVTGLLTASGGLTVTGTITMATAVSKLVPGATSFSVRNNVDGADNIIVTDAGAVTFRSTVGGITTLTATTLAGTLSTAAQTNVTSLGTLSGLTIGGNLTFTGVSRKLIPGTTDFTWRNNADNADNLKITDAGAATFRSTVGGITTLTATTLTGTLSTAAQTNITSVGTLASLLLSGGTAADIAPFAGNLTIKGISGQAILLVNNVTTMVTVDVSGFTINSARMIATALTHAPGAGVDGVLASFGGTITEAGSGNHALLSGLNIAAPTVSGAAATVTNTATVYIAGPMSATVSGANYALWVGAGTSRFESTVLTAASAAGAAGIRLPHGVAPTSPIDGELWTTTAGMFVRINGVTKTVTLT